MTALVKARVSG